jgi:transposase
MNYSGIDLHKDNSYITTVNNRGKKINESRIVNEEKLLLEYFSSISGKHKVVVESTSSWYWINDLLEGARINVILAHSKYLKAISYSKVKTDKVDSNTLANLLRMDLITSSHKISEELRGERDTMRMRLRLIQKRTSCYNSVHGIADKFNCDREIDFDKETIPEKLPKEYSLQVRLLYSQIELLNKQIKQLESILRPKLIPNGDVQRLLGVPAIGMITAFTIFLEVDGIERFTDAKKFLSYCRLVPGAKNSNKTIRHRSGNKDGNKYLKVAFTDAAVHAKRYYPEIRSYYQKMLRRSNKAIAQTLVAKEIAKIVYYILKNKTEYKGFKGNPIIKQKTERWPRLSNPNHCLE